MAQRPKPLVLIVRDGWGRNPNPEQEKYNAIALADTPRDDALLRAYPWTLIATSGEDVGLPEGTMGNSEVGHQNLGAGRVVDQESVRISKAIREGSFFENEALRGAIGKAKAADKYVHLMGLASDAGVHALLTHLYGCLELCKKMGQEKVALHLFMDGRDTGPYTGRGFAADIAAKAREIGVGQVASIIGRYYAMDRDNRWERVKQAYDALTGRAEPNSFPDAESAIQDYYDHPTNDSQNGDEFITPRVIGENWRDTRISGGDTVIFYNYRGDRPREITRAFMQPQFQDHVPPSPDTQARGFDRGEKLDLNYVTLTAYEEEFSSFPGLEVAYPKPPKMKNIAGEYLSNLGLTQFRCAETEKFPHVTFFFNDYRDQPFEGEKRQMAQSPQVSTYDLQPEMSAREVVGYVLDEINSDDCADFILVNFANGDMVGHTGKIDAAKAAIEAVDDCVGQIVDATLAKGGKLIVTADHGNADQLYDPETGSPHTAHTLYKVECIIVDPDRQGDASGSADTPSSALREGGTLADVFPTVLELMGLDQPEEMTGKSLIG
ncbi:MAG: 2,3-bisphosphoglycerate-independent phosphoglycerate mutase [Phycisphaeraceae bacterium]